MSSEIQLSDLAGFSKPAEVLIKKVCKGIGVVYEDHWGLVKRERARAKAKIIKDNAEQDIQIRAAERLIAEETRKQKNIESIVAKAISHLNEDADASKIDDDWICNFFENCRNVSDVEMQELLGKILAGEANHDGDYSRRTVNLLKDLESRHIRNFIHLVSLTLEFKHPILKSAEMFYAPIVHKLHDIKFFGSDFTEDAVKELQSLGLIEIQKDDCIIKQVKHKEYEARYFEHSLLVATSHDFINLGIIGITRWGKEISKACERKYYPQYWELVTHYLSKESLIQVGKYRTLPLS